MSADPLTIPVMEAINLTKTYRAHRGRSPVVALNGLNLALYRGDRLGIVGESGSGKSTLVKLLLALEEPSGGSVLFEGEPVTMTYRKGQNLAKLRRNVQVVFQDPNGSLDPRIRVGDSIAEPLRSLRIKEDIDARVNELLTAVGLGPSAADRYPHQFSGGQRQRIAIARALAPRPRVLVADEPVSALDVSVRAQMLNLLDELVSGFGLTLVFVSHDFGVVRHLCSRVAVLYRGNLVEEGSASDIYQSPKHGYTRSLIAAIPRLQLQRVVAPVGRDL